MAVRALPSQLQPTTNKRNAALLQRHMEEALGVSPSRGVLRFVPIPEEHLACGGKTVAGEIEELEMAGGYCHVGVGQRGSRGSGGSGGSFGAARWSVRSSSPVMVTAAAEDDEDRYQGEREDRASREIKGRRRLSVKVGFFLISLSFIFFFLFFSPFSAQATHPSFHPLRYHGFMGVNKRSPLPPFGPLRPPAWPRTN
ncbi:hypothetical protein VTG60DRAFT_5814 [Thermothelomyces hinnuleus]